MTTRVPWPMIGPDMKQRSTNVRNSATAGTRAVERALDVLRTIGEARSEPGLSEIADDLGLHKTTVFRLLGALERAEFVVRDEERQRYQLGPALFRRRGECIGRDFVCVQHERAIAGCIGGGEASDVHVDFRK